jgi:hypothetical protein
MLYEKRLCTTVMLRKSVITVSQRKRRQTVFANRGRDDFCEPNTFSDEVCRQLAKKEYTNKWERPI